MSTSTIHHRMPDAGSLLLDHEAEFQRTWADRNNTRLELPPVDVNQVLAEHYHTSEPLTFTRTMLWDMEERKAWRPDRYIPSVIREGSAQAWGPRSAVEGTESFVRSSQQRLWLEPEEYGLVLEQVHLNPTQQKVIFIGATGNFFSPVGDSLCFTLSTPLAGTNRDR